MTKSDLKAIKAQTLGCFWPSRLNALKQPAWVNIADEVRNAYLIERNRAEFMGEPLTHANELYRLYEIAKCQS